MKENLQNNTICVKEMGTRIAFSHWKWMFIGICTTESDLCNKHESGGSQLTSHLAAFWLIISSDGSQGNDTRVNDPSRMQCQANIKIIVYGMCSFVRLVFFMCIDNYFFPSPPSNAEVKNEWSCTTTPLYALLLCSWTTLYLFYVYHLNLSFYYAVI